MQTETVQTKITNDHQNVVVMKRNHEICPLYLVQSLLYQKLKTIVKRFFSEFVLLVSVTCNFLNKFNVNIYSSYAICIVIEVF